MGRNRPSERAISFELSAQDPIGRSVWEEAVASAAHGRPHRNRCLRRTACASPVLAGWAANVPKSSLRRLLIVAGDERHQPPFQLCKNRLGNGRTAGLPSLPMAKQSRDLRAGGRSRHSLQPSAVPVKTDTDRAKSWLARLQPCSIGQRVSTKRRAPVQYRD